MLKTKPAKEVVIRMPNAIGTLDKIARTMADKGINIRPSAHGWKGRRPSFAS
jgi:hypothetical protein